MLLAMIPMLTYIKTKVIMLTMKQRSENIGLVDIRSLRLNSFGKKGK